MSTFYTTFLRRIYSNDLADLAAPYLEGLLEKYRGKIPNRLPRDFTNRDSFLITYADQIHEPGKPPLQTLIQFCRTHISNLISGIHILPFFPSSSDDGFSIMDYRMVDPLLGEWQDIQQIARDFHLMMDGVVNHASIQGKWFQAFLQNEAPYNEYFLTVEGNPDLSRVVRPRTQSLLTEFQAVSGTRQVWTTFSRDQADLDYHNPRVLLEMLDILLMYVSRGAKIIRLDAIAYLWKEIGTSCIHLPQTHAIIQLIRAILDDLAPHVWLITETNVPHAENISYFGDGYNEAQMVYNFALPPLVMHTLRVGDSSVLSQWASDLLVPSDRTTFFNFLASHDGIGLNPAQGILTSSDIDALVDQTLTHGGFISYKHSMAGAQMPYELNINYFDALSNPNGDEPLSLQIDRFMVAQAIMLALRGVPGIYFHSLFGSRNWREGVIKNHQNRAINRQKMVRSRLETELANQSSIRSMVFNRFSRLLLIRASSPALHPFGDQEILNVGPRVFGILRRSPDGERKMICLFNLTARDQEISYNSKKIMISPYQYLWQDISNVE